MAWYCIDEDCLINSDQCTCKRHEIDLIGPSIHPLLFHQAHIIHMRQLGRCPLLEFFFFIFFFNSNIGYIDAFY